ncbi:MAG TPA: helix-turn-helix domain-containing protein [Puia sp.]|jgi:AraC family transcriptional activator of pobA|nr:helix-turn-helix domain-containing protein [Puia sp.]
MQQSTAESIPYLRDLTAFYKHVNARPPLHNDFDIREIDPKVLKNYDYVAKPFRHSFYCVALFLQGDVTLNSGFWKIRLQRPALYFKTPCQIVSWQKPAQWLQEYFIVFTEKFLADHKLLADIIFDLPFFQLEKAIPFELEPAELALLANIYKQILFEYTSKHPDKFALIASYLHTLFLHIRRLYNKFTEVDASLVSHVHNHEYILVEKFRSLIRAQIAGGEAESHNLNVKYFAGQLSVHPNHLNAVVKRQKEKTAIAFLHEQILHEAQSLLNQTNLTIKDIAFKLGFTDTSHFNNFFKKQTRATPVAYRRAKSL